MKSMILSAADRAHTVDMVRTVRGRLADVWDRGVRFSRGDKLALMAMLDDAVAGLACDCGVGAGAGLHSMLCQLREIQAADCR